MSSGGSLLGGVVQGRGYGGSNLGAGTKSAPPSRQKFEMSFPVL